MVDGGNNLDDLRARAQAAVRSLRARIDGLDADSIDLILRVHSTARV